MRSTKGLILLAVIAFGALFFAFNSGSPKADGGSLEQKRKLLAAIGNLLEQQHYSPKPIDDVFSKQVFKKFLEELDGEKNLFLKSDIQDLSKYETKIDDEIHSNADIAFAPAVNAIYDKRVDEAIKLYKEILSKPFDFSTDETYQADGDKLSYANDFNEKRDRWRKKLKYLTLERFVDLQNQREKAVNKQDSLAKKTDAQLEQEARDRVRKIMDKTFDRIKTTFKEDERFNTFINVITNQMDPHTDYFPPIEKRAFDEQMSGRFYGIGAQLQEQDGGIKIASLVTGGPAWKNGQIEVNDIITKVGQGNAEPVDITGYGVTDAVKLIRGNKGTEVTLTLKKQSGTIKTVTIQRDEIVQDEGYARSVIINENGKHIGYIYLPDFYADYERPDGNRCSEDVAKEIIKLKTEGIDGLIVDLRNNGGGSLYEVVQMVGLFISQGPVVQVRDKEGKSSVLSDNNKGVLYDGPLTVMVNELSASASEIFAAAIQDYKRGIVIGSSSTYGKGTVQRSIPFGKVNDLSSNRTDMGAVKLTFQKFYRISGGSTQLKGVTPDVIIPDSYEYLKIREKDNPVALPWDEIKKADYSLANNQTIIDNQVVKANAYVASNSTLSLIKANAKWLYDNNEQPYNLNITKYKNKQAEVKATVSQNGSLTTLKTPMDVTTTAADKDKFFNNPDKQKGDRYQDWLKALKNDFYVKEAATIVKLLVE